MIMAKKYKLINSNPLKRRIIVINAAIKAYNFSLYKYTKQFHGRIPVLKDDFTKVSDKKYMSLKEYFHSNPIWVQIDDFLKTTDVNIYEYCDIMVKNWFDISIRLNITNQKKPIPSIVFSSKMIPIFEKYVELDERHIEMNKHKAVKKSDNYYLLVPSLQSNINSLFKLKKLNSDLSYHDIVTLFKGEFESEFIDVVLSVNNEQIDSELLAQLLSQI